MMTTCVSPVFMEGKISISGFSTVLIGGLIACKECCKYLNLKLHVIEN